MYFPYVLISMPENAPKGIMDDAQATLMKSISNSLVIHTSGLQKVILLGFGSAHPAVLAQRRRYRFC